MKSNKTFDAVQMMRKLRDNLSKELKGKNFEEQKRILRNKIDKSKKPATSLRRSKSKLKANV